MNKKPVSIKVNIVKDCFVLLLYCLANQIILVVDITVITAYLV